MSKILLSGKPRRKTWKDLDKEMKSKKDKDTETWESMPLSCISMHYNVAGAQGYGGLWWERT